MAIIDLLALMAQASRKWPTLLYPSPFKLHRCWLQDFTRWYNEEHRHSGIKFLAPGQRHRGETRALMDNRKEVYALAKELHPERWGKRETRNWDMADEVWLNPDKCTAGQLSKVA